MSALEPHAGVSGAEKVAIDQWVDRHRDEMLEVIGELIRIPTENRPPVGDELAGQEFFHRLLTRYGAKTDLFYLHEVEGLTEHEAYWPGREYANRPNVVGTFTGSGGGRSLGFSSHMDTASRDPLPWEESEPFSGEIKGDRLYGRGSYDMKAALIASLYAVRAVREAGISLRGDVIVESVVDEEWGGSNGTLAARLRGYNPDAFVVPEPSHMVICPAHLGVRLFRITARGDAGMRFGGEGLANPVLAMNRVIEEFTKFAAERQAMPLPPVYEGGDPPPIDIMGIHAEGYGVPRECTLDFHLHCFLGETEVGVNEAVRQFVERMQAHPDLEGVTLSVEPTSRFIEPTSIPVDHPIVECAVEAMEDVPGREPIVRGAPFACDAFIFNKYSPSPALILGPGGARAHAADEYVLVEDLVDLVRIYARMIVAWCR